MLSNPVENEVEIGYKVFSNKNHVQRTINFFNNKSDSCLTNSNSMLVGGKNKVWRQILENIGQKHVESFVPHRDVGEMVNLAYELKKNFECNPIKINPQCFESTPELFNAVADHAKRWQRLEQSTIEHRMRYARRMAKHPVFPINFFNLDYNQFIAYMQYREDYEHAGYFALKHDLQTFQTFLHAYGIDPRKWYYRLPSKPSHKERILPLPDVVHSIINHVFSDDPYENALFQYLHAHNFWIGWRVPSEPCLMTVDDIDFDTDSIIITEQKKHRSTRQIFPEKVIMTGRTRKSFKNWLRWRDKVETSRSGNALYLQPSGKPFTVNHLGNRLSKTGKLVFPNFRPYDARHWCAVARLIQTKIQSGHYDCYTVKNWLGHEKLATTEGYIQHADNYFKRAGFDWISHTLRFNKNNFVVEDSVETSKQGLETCVSFGDSSRGESGLGEIRTLDLRHVKATS